MHTVNFFQPLLTLISEGEVMFNIEIGKNGYMMVSVLYTHKDVKDSSFKRIPPMIFKGYAKELDEKLFTALVTPMKKTVDLALNMLNYEQTLDEIAKVNTANQRKQSAKNDKPVRSYKLVPTENGKVLDEAEAQTPITEAAKTPEEILAAKKQVRFDEIMAEVNALADTGNYTGAWLKVPTMAEFPDMADVISARKSELSEEFRH